MRKIWKYLGVLNHQKISTQVYNYVVNHTNALDLLEKYIDPVPIDQLPSHCPLLADFLHSRQLIPKQIGIIAVDAQSGIRIHTDTSDSNPYVRIAWPVHNCQGSKTKFWKLEQIAGAQIYNVGVWNGTIFQDCHHGEPIDEFELIAPVLLDTSVPHSVHPNSSSLECRISLTIEFDRDLPISKSIDAWVDF